MARKLVWETAAWSSGTRGADAFVQVAYQQVGYGILIAAAEVEDAPKDRIWVERIVGSAYGRGFNAAAAPPAIVYKERISVGRRWDPVVAAPGDVSRPFAGAQAIDNFLWERVNRTRYETTSTLSAINAEADFFVSPTDHPYWSNIDVRVGRLLEPTDFLAYTVEPDPNVVSGGSFVQVHAWLRVLISRL